MFPPPSPFSVPRPLVVFSHLRWDFVYQRPQHVLSRLAARRPVLVVEEPVVDEGDAHWERQSPAPGVTVLRPHTSVQEDGFTDAQIEATSPLVAALAEEVGPCDAWFYTPLALPLLDALDDAGSVRTVVYDCMDELAAFDHAPAALLDRERDLLERADLVFTGGPSLYRAKRDRHPAVHCFPSSVDAGHFGAARPDAPALDEPADQREIPHPRLGFFGVIDERLDRDLVAALAAARPDWHVVMLGPVVKIDAASLPAAPTTSTGSGGSPTASCPPTSPGGTCACSRSPGTGPPSSSARRRRWSTWPPSGRSSRRRSRTWPSPTATWSTSARRPRPSSPPAPPR